MLGFIGRMARRVAAHLRLITHYAYDMRRYRRHASSAHRRMTDDALRARLFQKAHSIEKGLAMPMVRPGFGEAALAELRNLIEEAAARELPADEPCFAKAVNVFAAYVNFHKTIAAPLPSKMAFVPELAATTHDASAGGTQVLNAETVRADARSDFAALARSRHSVRMFSASPVSQEAIDTAVTLAMRSPSVCNRQGSRVYRIGRKDLKETALRIQGGNRGFGTGIDTLLVVTNRLYIYRGARERNQCWVDGGLFAMSLLYALHHQGLGACALNWSADKTQDTALRRLLGLPDSEAIIMLIGAGNLRDQFTVAASPRRLLGDVLIDLPSAPGGGNLLFDKGRGDSAPRRELV